MTLSVNAGATPARPAERPEVVVVGAGLAGLVAAYELRDRELVVLEADERVGGRTLSGPHGEYWYNLGAQFVWDKRTLGICRQLGIGLLPGEGARSSLFVRGRLVSAPTPFQMFLSLPLTAAERADLAKTVLRLRWLARRLSKPAGRAYDAVSLRDLMGRSSTVTQQIMDLVTLSGTGLDASEVSGWIGLGYAIHLFGGNVNGTLKQVAGGTQSITAALQAAVGPQRILLGAEVTRVARRPGGVVVSYRRDGEACEIPARACVLAVPATQVERLASDLPAGKLAAIRAMTPYAPIVATAWLTGETAPMPWDGLLVVPALDDLSFEQVINNSFFLRRRHRAARHPGGTLVTLSTAHRATPLWGLDDAQVRERVGEDLERMFPAAGRVLRAAQVRVARWHGLPPFRRGWLRYRDDLRAAVGPVYFCGDYTAQPGTPGAVGSGHHVARAVRGLLEEQRAADDGAGEKWR
jgi:oxygen-dependent protoporphyrinogen oxidase